MNVTVDNFELDYIDRYRIYSDTEEGRKNALEWAKQNGFESMFTVGLQ
jgi:hypothetical protein